MWKYGSWVLTPTLPYSHTFTLSELGPCSSGRLGVHRRRLFQQPSHGEPSFVQPRCAHDAPPRETPILTNPGPVRHGHRQRLADHALAAQLLHRVQPAPARGLEPTDALRAESERDGPIVANITSSLMTPTAFSAVK